MATPMKTLCRILPLLAICLTLASCSKNRGNGTPLGQVPRSEWPSMATWAMKKHLTWGQCPECGAVVTMRDVEASQVTLECGRGGIIGMHCVRHFLPVRK
jgi:hypothetical protein